MICVEVVIRGAVIIQITKKKLEFLYYKLGMSQGEIGKIIGRCRITVRNKFKKMGITKGKKKMAQDGLLKKKLEILWYERRYKREKIANLLGYHETTISVYFSNFNIVTKGPGRYGIDLDEIIKMYKNGMNQREIGEKFELARSTISKWLNEAGVNEGGTRVIWSTNKMQQHCDEYAPGYKVIN
jgi:transposase